MLSTRNTVVLFPAFLLSSGILSLPSSRHATRSVYVFPEPAAAFLPNAPFPFDSTHAEQGNSRPRSPEAVKPLKPAGEGKQPLIRFVTGLTRVTLSLIGPEAGGGAAYLSRVYSRRSVSERITFPSDSRGTKAFGKFDPRRTRVRLGVARRRVYVSVPGI